ncbi:MAG: hypothetical protein ACYCPA_06960 [Acidithiobacillus sp.]
MSIPMSALRTLSRTSRDNPKESLLEPTGNIESPAIRRIRDQLRRIQQEKERLTAKTRKKEQEQMDSYWLEKIRAIAPDWSLGTIVGALAAAVAECQDDPTYFDEITAYGATISPPGCGDE